MEDINSSLIFPLLINHEVLDSTSKYLLSSLFSTKLTLECAGSKEIFIVGSLFI